MREGLGVFSRPLLLKLYYAQKSRGGRRGVGERRILLQKVPGGLKFCASDKLPGKANAPSQNRSLRIKWSLTCSKAQSSLS